ncbi:MAG: PEGA domain-containing protein [Bacteroidetes bacterium]|nr:PEGA domain-containing protein [Bacteroidota bacterium]
MKTILCLLFIVDGLSAQTEKQGHVVFKSPGQIRTVFINDSAMTCDDEGRLTLSPGTYNIRVPNPRPAQTRYPDFSTTVLVKSGEDTPIQVSFKTLHLVDTTPSGCEVFLGEERLGTTPLELDFSNRISTQLRIEKLGFETRTVDVDQVLLESPVISITLTPLTPNVRINENLFASGEIQKEGLHEYKKQILTVGVLGLATGTLAAYYKSKADRAFENAKLARRLGDQNSKQKFLKRASRYDGYAAAGYIVMQVNVVALFYFLFQSN